MAVTALPRRYQRAALIALCMAAAVSVSACQPAATLAKVGAGGTGSPVASTPMPTYSSPSATRLATVHKVTAPALNAYPWANDQTNSSDPYGETKRQCVSYVAWYLNSHGTPFGYHTQGPRGTATFGNATTWDAAATKDGFTVSAKPLVGSVAQWHANEISTWTVPGGFRTMMAGGAGHVAVVTRVYTNGNVDLAQYNIGGTRAYSVMLNVRAPRYIYVPLASPNVP
jgi:surface antigen